MGKRKKQQNSSLTQGKDKLTLIKRKLRKNDEKYLILEQDYKRLYESFSDINNKLKESENNHNELATEHEETLKQLSETKEGYAIERFLKNEAYAFLLAEGLLNKFLEFREHFHRTKAQEVLYNLVAEAKLGGLWIDL